MNIDFLSLNPSEWHRNDEFSKSLLLVRNLKVVDDIGERAIKQIEDYNQISIFSRIRESLIANSFHFQEMFENADEKHPKL
ncbi:hypothetical protein PV325_010820, partial [Microctonus aethiopoides]